MTYTEAVRRLQSAGIEEAGWEAKLLFSGILGLPLHELPFRQREDFASPALEEALARRERREPLQYILGSWSFRGLEFRLNADCLCPRPDTETLVERACALLPRGAYFCDLGTGSGAIAVSVLHERPDTRALCADICEGALAAARENAGNCGVGDRCGFCVCDMLQPGELLALGTFDAVLSNPPYIRSAEIDGLAPELRYEPRRALDGGSDGLDFYRAMLACRSLTTPQGFYLFEIGFDQGDDLRRLAAREGLQAEITRDPAGRDRVVYVHA